MIKKMVLTKTDKKRVLELLDDSINSFINQEIVIRKMKKYDNDIMFVIDCLRDFLIYRLRNE